MTSDAKVDHRGAAAPKNAPKPRRKNPLTLVWKTFLS